VNTHGVEVELIGDVTLKGVAQTGSGTLLILENVLGAYAIYSPVRTKMYHVHIPVQYLDVKESRITLNVDIVNDEKGVKDVLKDLLVCLKLAECYIDTELKGDRGVWTELRSVMPLRLISLIPFGVPPHISRYTAHDKAYIPDTL